uniref:Uncharacterized protein n=1 Tax=viral metagenome TaxID=1070528 RepID=A0A6C0JHI3_9ZZZZ
MSFDEGFQYYNDEEDDEGEFVMFNARDGFADDSTDFSSVSTIRKKQRKQYEELKQIDKGYHKIKIGDRFDKSQIELYSTGDAPGTLVRDAVTGSRYKEFRVGTLYEHLFYKAKLVCGVKSTESVTFFFDSPEQFERVLKTTVSQLAKERWTNKCAEIKTRFTN